MTMCRALDGFRRPYVWQYHSYLVYYKYPR